MTFEVLTTATCGWSIRNIVALMEKGAAFTLVDVAEGGRKAAWYTALTPFGKTPALRHADRIVVESRVINEYIEEVAAGRRLLPVDPLKRAWARIWSGYCDEELMQQVRMVASGEPAKRQQGLDQLDAALGRLEAHVFSSGEPGAFWGGKEVSLVDICYWSFFDVMERVEELRAARTLLLKRPLVAEWSRNVLGHPAFLEANTRLQALHTSG